MLVNHNKKSKFGIQKPYLMKFKLQQKIYKLGPFLPLPEATIWILKTTPATNHTQAKHD